MMCLVNYKLLAAGCPQPNRNTNSSSSDMRVIFSLGNLHDQLCSLSSVCATPKNRAVEPSAIAMAQCIIDMCSCIGVGLVCAVSVRNIRNAKTICNANGF